MEGDAKLLTLALAVAIRAKGKSSIAAQGEGPREALYQALSTESEPRLSPLTEVLKAQGLRLSFRAA